MLPGEQTSYVSSLGTLFLVPMTDGGAKPLPKSIRKPQHPDVLQAATRNAAAHPCSNLFNSDLLREQSISPIQCTSTNFRLFLKPVSTRGSTGADSVRLCREIAIPYMLVDRYEIEIRAPKIFALAVYTKWTWVLRIQSVTEEPIQSLASILQHNFPQAVQQFFAFTYFRALVDELHSPYGVNGAGGHQPLVGLRKESGMEFEAPSGELLQRSQTIVMQLSSSSDPVPPSLRDGDGVYDTAWGAFNIERELHRQTVLNGTPFDKDDIPMNLPPAGYTALNQFGCGKNLLPWFHIVKLARIDIFYTYPTTVIMPRKVSEELLNKCAAYRHAGRVPVVTWIHGVNGATLSRSAQPKAGSRKPAKDDQTLCSYLNQSYHHTNAAPSTSHHDPTADGRGGVGGSASNRTRTVSPPPPPFLRSGIADGYPVGLSKKPPSLFETSSSDLLDEADIALAIPIATTAATATTPTLQPTASAHTTTASETTTTANKSEMRPLHIVDCRSRTAATANLATGGGFENARNYDRACIDFMGLDNIHVVRDSFDKLRKLCVSMQQPQLDAPTTKTAYGSFHSRLESTGWVELQERLIWASWKTATLLAGGASVLVHCTDGWDRTAQVTSLAKIQLDAHYRSVEGFCELVMVEWLEMGHKFADRCGLERSAPSEDNDEGFVHVDSDGEEESDNEDETNFSAAHAAHSPRAVHQEDFKGPTTQHQQGGGIASFFTSPKRNKSHSPSSQLSPIFIQFIDAVFQLVHMFPTAFEFTPVFLEMLLESVYSCQFGTFLYNTHRLRTKKNGLVSKTMSVWGAIEHRLTRERMKSSSCDGATVAADERLLNVFYHPVSNRCPKGSSCEDIAAAFSQQRIIPSFHAFRYRMWASLYARYMWEGTGCPTDGESYHPMADALLFMAEKYRALESKLLIMNGDASSAGGGGGLTSYLASWVGGGDSTVPTSEANSEILVNRYMFHNRVAQSHLTAEWQLLTRNASDTPTAIDSEGGRPILMLGGGDMGSGDGMADASQLHSPSTAGTTNGIGLQGAGNVVVFKTRDDKNHCQLCSTEFTMFYRRHTCRRCCRTACTKCADTFMIMPPNSIALYDDRGATHPVRICNLCAMEMRRLSTAK